MARRTDPETSHEAERSISSDHLSKLEQAILFELSSPMTDEQLCQKLGYKAWAEGGIRASDSGIRTRRCLLERRGLVVDTGDRAKTRSGRNAIVWRLA